MGKKLATGLVWLVVLVVAAVLVRYWHAASRPDYWKAQNQIHGAIRAEHGVNAAQAVDETKVIVDKARSTGKVTDNATLMNAIMPSANRARDLDRGSKAWDARAADRDESVISTVVPVYQSGWATMPNDSATRAVREVRVPTLVTVNGIVTPEFYPGHRANPDGKVWEPEGHRSRTVLMNERGLAQPTQQTGNLNQAIGRFCQDKDGMNCRNGFPVGSRAVLCVGPGLHDGGFLQTWYNGLQMIDGVVMSLYFSGTEKSSGKFNFVVTPDDPSNGQTFATNVCAQYPGVLVVQLPEVETPVAAK